MRTLLLTLVLLLAAAAAHAHPGSAIAVSNDGTVYFVDTGGGVFSIDAKGEVVRREGPAFHWFAFDPSGRFRKTPWPPIPGGELRWAGNVILSSDVPIVIGTDGRFYYPEAMPDQRVRIVAVEPSGTRSVFANLPRHAFPWVNGLAAGPNGSIYYTEHRAIRKIDRRGQVSAVAANVAVPNCAAIPGTEPQTGPYLRGLAVAADGTVYVAAAGCGAVLRVAPNGQVTPVLRASAPWSPTAIAVRGADVYVLEYLHTASDNRVEWIPRIRRISGGKVSTLGGSTRR